MEFVVMEWSRGVELQIGQSGLVQPELATGFGRFGLRWAQLVTVAIRAGPSPNAKTSA